MCRSTSPKLCHVNSKTHKILNRTSQRSTIRASLPYVTMILYTGWSTATSAQLSPTLTPKTGFILMAEVSVSWCATTNWQSAPTLDYTISRLCAAQVPLRNDTPPAHVAKMNNPCHQLASRKQCPQSKCVKPSQPSEIPLNKCGRAHPPGSSYHC